MPLLVFVPSLFRVFVLSVLVCISTRARHEDVHICQMTSVCACKQSNCLLSCGFSPTHGSIRAQSCLQESQRLMVEYHDYPTVLLRMVRC